MARAQQELVVLAVEQAQEVQAAKAVLLALEAYSLTRKANQRTSVAT